MISVTAYPTIAAVPPDSGAIWQHPERIYAADASYASNAVTGTGVNGGYLIAYGFGFAIPADAIIRGVTVAVKRYATGSVTDKYVYLNRGDESDTIGDNLAQAAAWPGTPGVIRYAGDPDLLTPAIVNDPQFGFSIRIAGSGAGGTGYVDAISVTIDYEMPVLGAGGELATIADFIYSTLTEDATLAALIGTRVHEEVAPANTAAYPLVVFARMSGADVNGSGATRIATNAVYLVKAVSKNKGHSESDPIAARIDALLHGHRAEMDGGTIVSCYRDEPFSDTEVDSGQTFYSRGGQYRILVH